INHSIGNSFYLSQCCFYVAATTIAGHSVYVIGMFHYRSILNHSSNFDNIVKFLLWAYGYDLSRFTKKQVKALCLTCFQRNSLRDYADKISFQNRSQTLVIAPGTFYVRNGLFLLNDSLHKEPTNAAILYFQYHLFYSVLQSFTLIGIKFC